MSSYPPDPACAAELEQATTPDAKRAILEKHGWTCDKKGDRWTYRKGDGRVIKSLTTLVKELSNNDPFASGSDDDDAKDVNAPIDAFFGTLGPHGFRCSVAGRSQETIDQIAGESRFFSW